MGESKSRREVELESEPTILVRKKKDKSKKKKKKKEKKKKEKKAKKRKRKHEEGEAEEDSKKSKNALPKKKRRKVVLTDNASKDEDDAKLKSLKDLKSQVSAYRKKSGKSTTPRKRDLTRSASKTVDLEEKLIQEKKERSREKRQESERKRTEDRSHRDRDRDRDRDSDRNRSRRRDRDRRESRRDSSRRYRSNGTSPSRNSTQPSSRKAPSGFGRRGFSDSSDDGTPQDQNKKKKSRTEKKTSIANEKETTKNEKEILPATSSPSLIKIENASEKTKTNPNTPTTTTPRSTFFIAMPIQPKKITTKPSLLISKRNRFDIHVRKKKKNPLSFLMKLPNIDSSTSSDDRPEKFLQNTFDEVSLPEPLEEDVVIRKIPQKMKDKKNEKRELELRKEREAVVAAQLAIEELAKKKKEEAEAAAAALREEEMDNTEQEMEMESDEIIEKKVPPSLVFSESIISSNVQPITAGTLQQLVPSPTHSLISPINISPTGGLMSPIAAGFPMTTMLTTAPGGHLISAGQFPFSPQPAQLLPNTANKLAQYPPPQPTATTPVATNQFSQVQTISHQAQYPPPQLAQGQQQTKTTPIQFINPPNIAQPPPPPMSQTQQQMQQFPLSPTPGTFPTTSNYAQPPNPLLQQRAPSFQTAGGFPTNQFAAPPPGLKPFSAPSTPTPTQFGLQPLQPISIGMTGSLIQNPILNLSNFNHSAASPTPILIQNQQPNQQHRGSNNQNGALTNQFSTQKQQPTNQFPPMQPNQRQQFPPFQQQQGQYPPPTQTLPMQQQNGQNNSFPPLQGNNGQFSKRLNTNPNSMTPNLLLHPQPQHQKNLPFQRQQQKSSSFVPKNTNDPGGFRNRRQPTTNSADQGRDRTYRSRSPYNQSDSYSRRRSRRSNSRDRYDDYRKRSRSRERRRPRRFRSRTPPQYNPQPKFKRRKPDKSYLLKENAPTLEEYPLTIASTGSEKEHWTCALDNPKYRSFACIRKNPFDEETLRTWFKMSEDKIPWEQPLVNGKPLPRKAAFFVSSSDCSCHYRYSDTKWKPHPYPDWFREITERVCDKLGLDFKKLPNACNVNLYTDGSHSVGWHSDNEPLFESTIQDCLIISLSLGASRKFQMQFQHEGTTEEVKLENGDLMTMEGLFQRYYSHRVPREMYCKAPRINFTWRFVTRHYSKQDGCTLNREASGVPGHNFQQYFRDQRFGKSASKRITRIVEPPVKKKEAKETSPNVADRFDPSSQ